MALSGSAKEPKSNPEAMGVDDGEIENGCSSIDIQEAKVALESGVSLAAGRGGEVHRGLKSRHIQFL